MGSQVKIAVGDNERVGMLGVTCPKDHQIWLVYFPSLDNYGFHCTVCHTFGTMVHYQKGPKTYELEIAWVSGREVKGLSGDLLLFREIKAHPVVCGKNHMVGLMVLAGAEDFGFMEDHCKLYSLTIEDRGRTLKVRERNHGIIDIN